MGCRRSQTRKDGVRIMGAQLPAGEFDFRKTEHLMIKCEEYKTKTAVYGVANHKTGVYLGQIKWNNGWRRYCYFAGRDLVFDSGCLDTISAFIKDLMEDRMEARKL